MKNLKFKIKTGNVFALLTALTLGIGLWPLDCPAQTPVLFSLQSLTGSVNNRSIYIAPDTYQNPLWFGTNLVDTDPFEIQPTGGVVITNLEPWGYTIKVDGWPRSVHIVVPASTNIINAVSLISTNQFAPLNLFVTNVSFSGGTYDYNALSNTPAIANAVTNGGTFTNGILATGTILNSTADGGSGAISLGKSSSILNSIYDNVGGGGDLELGILGYGMKIVNRSGAGGVVSIAGSGSIQNNNTIGSTAYPGIISSESYQRDKPHAEQAEASPTPPVWWQDLFDFSSNPLSTNFNDGWVRGVAQFMSTNGLFLQGQILWFDANEVLSNSVGNANGTPIVDTNRFPNMTNLCAYIHSLGGRVGFHYFIDTDIMYFSGFYGFGGDGNSVAVVNCFSSWGADGVFIDSPDSPAQCEAGVYQASDAIARTGKKMLLGFTSYNFSAWVTAFNSGLGDTSSYNTMEPASSSSTFWQSGQGITSGDGAQRWNGDILANIANGKRQKRGSFCESPDNIVLSEGTNDLQCGLTVAALCSSPIQWGSFTTVTSNPALYLGYLTNSVAAFIRNDALFSEPTLISSNNSLLIWYKPMTPPFSCIGFENQSNTVQTATFNMTNTPYASNAVFEAWAGNYTPLTNSLTAVVPTNGMDLFLLSSVKTNVVVVTNLAFVATGDGVNIKRFSFGESASGGTGAAWYDYGNTATLQMDVNGWQFNNQANGFAAAHGDQLGDATFAGVFTAKGFASTATNSAAFTTGGITNTTGVILRVAGFTGTTVIDTNFSTHIGWARGTITAPADIILETNEALIGASCACNTNLAL